MESRKSLANNSGGLSFSTDVLALNPGLAESSKTKTASKYHNARADAHGMTFQSGHEAAVIGGLIIAEEHKHIFGLRLQVSFPLAGGNVYRADAVYLDEAGLEPVVADAKAWDEKTQKFLLTPEFKLKAKLFLEKYGREIKLL